MFRMNLSVSNDTSIYNEFDEFLQSKIIFMIERI